ncbi:MAG: hypothetical protein ACE5LU_22640 [Anaerolineae bacterium]
MNTLKIRTGYEEWINDPARRRSPELDFGVWWKVHGRDFPRWRVSWIDDTGELYARELGTDRFIILGIYETEEKVERRMDGWASGQFGGKDLADFFGDAGLSELLSGT